jgi:TonB family protein
LLILHHEVATYPEEARRDGIQGKVAVELTVDEKGDVTDARVLDGPEPLRNAALEAARKWRFAPPSQAPVSATVVVDFVLPDRPLQESTQPETNGKKEQEQVSKHDLVQGKLELAAAESTDAKPASETKPVPIYKPEPPYPPEAREAKIREATVLCWIDIDTEGKVSHVRVEKSAGHRLDEITEKTLRTWKFKPALRDGVPVPTREKVEISFRLF